MAKKHPLWAVSFNVGLEVRVARLPHLDPQTINFMQMSITRHQGELVLRGNGRNPDIVFGNRSAFLT